MNLEGMKAEVYKWAHTKGWEPDPNRTLADECALLHSEISEALEAYREWKLHDPTESSHTASNDASLPPGPPKPLGVGSEMADVLIRLLHYSASGRFHLIEIDNTEHSDLHTTFGAWIANMHLAVSLAYYDHLLGSSTVLSHMSYLLRTIRRFCDTHGIDLQFEYRRKMDYNMSRTYRHGGKAM
jgi:NTP pyrophosphatase (non-canonical NTP hydrolase)